MSPTRGAACRRGAQPRRAEVHGVVTFYHDFRRAPAGRHVVKLCRAEACQARGGAAIERAAIERLGVAMGATRADGQVTLEPVYCLGLCASGPNALVDGVPVVAARRRAALDRHRRAGGGMTGSSSPATWPRSRSAPTRWPSASPRAGAEVVRTGSRGLFALEPLVEVETPEGRIGYRAGRRRTMSRRCSPAAHPNRLGDDRGAALLRRAAALHLRPLRRDRSARLDDYRAHGGWAGLDAARALAPQAGRRRGQGHRACAAAAGRASRPGSSGRPCRRAGPTRNTSSATPTRATAAPSPTGC